MDDFYAELDEGLFEQGTSSFEIEEVEGNDDHDNDICALLLGKGLDWEVPEEEEVDVNRNVDAKVDELLTEELPKKKRFMSSDAVCNDNNFSGSSRAAPRDIQMEKSSR